MCALWSLEAPITEYLCLHALAQTEVLRCSNLELHAPHGVYICLTLHDGHVATTTCYVVRTMHRCHRVKARY